MKTLSICLLVAVFALPAVGDVTVFYDEVDVYDTIWDTPAGSFDDMATWTHSVSQDVLDSEILTASLTVDVSGIFAIDRFFSPTDDRISVYLNGSYLGLLTGGSAEGYTTVFSGQSVIDALTVTDPLASAVIEWSWTGIFDLADAAKIMTSTLEGTYDLTDSNANTVGTITVPTPSAILLAGIGTTLIGVLRKRR